MLEWNERQRTVLIDKLADLANLAAAGLVFGQALTGGRISIWLATAGAISWLVLPAASMWLASK